MAFSDWLSTGLSVLAGAGVCALAAASLLTIGWVLWIVSDEGRLVDYRRRVDDALHCHALTKTRWGTAMLSEARYATRYVRDRVTQHRDRVG